MFQNSGRKLRGVAMVAFAVIVICALISWVVITISGEVVGFFLGMLSAALTVFAGWISVLNTVAVADAADFAQEAANNSYKILRKLEKMNVSTEEPEKAPEVHVPLATVVAQSGGSAQKKYDVNRIPAWKRVQMEQQAGTEEK